MSKIVDFKKEHRKKRISEGVQRTKEHKLELEARIAEGKSPLCPKAMNTLANLISQITIDENGMAIPVEKLKFKKIGHQSKDKK